MKRAIPALPLLLALAASALADGPPPPAAETALVHDFAALTPAGASRLHGQRGLFLIRLNSEPESDDGRVVCDCLGADGTNRSVWFGAGYVVEDDGPEMVVEATLNVFHLDEWVAPDGTRLEAVTEYRLEDARRWP